MAEPATLELDHLLSVAKAGHGGGNPSPEGVGGDLALVVLDGVLQQCLEGGVELPGCDVCSCLPSEYRLGGGCLELGEFSPLPDGFHRVEE